MVELDLEDYAEIFKWFNDKHDETEKDVTEQGRKTFWKLHFLLEDKMRELDLHLKK
tara:strand:- start:990 stop:1157 length:168 start_codon:yes stop_codon:yes gene_type:complete